MSDFAEAALEIAAAFDDELSEQVQDFTFTEIASQTDYDYRGIADSVKQFETDGESVTMTSGKWFCLRHELPVTPKIDDVITIDGLKHHISRVSPTDNVIGWYLFTNA